MAVTPAALALGMLGVHPGCGVGSAPRPRGDEFVPGQAHRVIKGGIERVWPRVLAAVSDEGLTVERSHRPGRVIACAPERHAGPTPEMLREVRTIADVGAARGRIQLVSDYVVTYTLFLAELGGDTSLKIVAGIEVTDRSQVMAVAPGIVQRMPVRLALPSRGVVERRLLHRIATSLFGADEMLYYLGDLGYE
jgi:hypothetical protein